MTDFRIAHFSDTHVLSLTGIGPGRFLNKRATGAVNLALNRARQYRVDVFQRLLDAVGALAPDHVVCTGDLVNLALEPEFERVGGMLRAAFRPEQLTLVPGNHDYYVADAARAALFETHFGAWQPHDIQLDGGRYPVCRLLPEVAIIGLSSAEPTPVFMATGRIGPPQLAALSALLRLPEVQNRFRLVLVHHPLLPDPSRPLDVMRRLVDAPALVETLRGAPPDLIAHGHNHVFLRNALPGTTVPIIQVASGSRYSRNHYGEFNVYVIRDGRLAAVERHILDPQRMAFVGHDEHGRPLPARAA